MIKRYASLRYDASNGPSEVDAIARAISSNGAVVSSLKSAGGRCYASLELELSCDPQILATLLRRAFGATLDLPAWLVLDVRTESDGDAARVREALGGPGGLTSAVTHAADERSTIVEFDETRTSLALVLDLIDTELEGRPRHVVPLVPIDDGPLARFAGARLSEPDLDETRVIETHLAAADTWNR